MFFSVIIPTYHRNELLARCLERLAPDIQTLSSDQYEVIVSDDGKNSTAENLLRERFPWAHWIQGPQRGPAASRNFATTHANGTWLVFTDDDCIPDPGWLQAYADAITPESLAYEGCTTCVQPFSPLLEETPMNLTRGCFWSCNIMIAPSVFHSIQGFDENFPYPFQEDTDFREKLKAAGYSFPFVPNAIVDHPARPRRLGKRMGEVRECDALLWYKGGQQSSAVNHLIRNILRSHWDRFRLMHYLSRDTWIALYSMLGEMKYVLVHVKYWDKKIQNTPKSYNYRQI
jgi:GT2 family glycosyltransferase